VEHSAINLMNELVNRGHEISLFTWDRAGAKPFFPMSPAVHWFRLDMGDPWQKAGLRLRLERMRRFRRYTRDRQPAVIIGFQPGTFLFAAASLPRRRIPLFLAERNSPDRMDYLREGRFRWRVFQTMRLASTITVQWESYINRYPAYLRSRIVAIPNPVYPPNGFASPGEKKTSYTLLSVGRLSYQKNYETLIRAFAGLEDQYPHWRLRIVGEGESRPALEKFVSELGLGRRVQMEGHTLDVSAQYQAADLFCLPSLFEGFPNTLAEAMAHGLPAVAFAGCAGIDELIKTGRNGVLADGNGDTESLARTLGELMGNAGERARLGEAARKVAQDYHPEEIYDTWERLFLKDRLTG
jgi:GalNAc-alpha-(1->4)-GalNAc-alpha-(1->3)-diNAcBac-PP-undecaprenol alpha-1,4-N-acetyl-D-galactosaminyltransferase